MIVARLELDGSLTGAWECRPHPSLPLVKEKILKAIIKLTFYTYFSDQEFFWRRHTSSQETRSFQQDCVGWRSLQNSQWKKLSWHCCGHHHAFSAVLEKKEVTSAFRQEYFSKTHPTHPAELPSLAGDVLEEQVPVHRWQLPCSHQLYWNGSTAKETTPKFTVEEATCKWLMKEYYYSW